MIPATSFLLDGDTALLVLEYPQPVDAPTTVQWRYELNRPCDTCEGAGWDWKKCADDDRQVDDPVGEYPCPDCIDGIGRWTFDIDIDHDPYDGYFDTLRVHVIDVLPIHDWCPDEKPADHICHAWKAGQQSDLWWHHRSFDNSDWTERQITLPPDAAPGKWLVRLKVHQ